MKRTVVALMALALPWVAVPAVVVPVHASTPVLQGSTVANAGVRFGCEDAACTAFRDAGCPEALAAKDGATISIVDVSGLGGQTLTFTWSDASMRLYDATGGVGVPISPILFYAIGSCGVHVPTDFPDDQATAFTLNTEPAHRSASYKIPVGTHWLIAEPMYNAASVTWSAS